VIDGAPAIIDLANGLGLVMVWSSSKRALRDSPKRQRKDKLGAALEGGRPASDGVDTVRIANE
jgi:hypothetical protein